MKKRAILNKRGDMPILGTVIFIVLNLMFALILTYFAYKSSTGAAVYEQSYAKEIAFLIDEAKPNTTIVLGMQKAVDIANENGKDLAGVIKIDDLKKEVTVSLSLDKGYTYQYFSGYRAYASRGLDGGTDLIIRVENG